ncbi:tyrosine-type recombinase/integrase [Planctomycetota bacterium]
MARIFRQTYTKPLPEGSEVFTRKGKRYARFKDAKGKTVTAPLSHDGSKIIREAKKWYIEYRNADDVIKRVAGFTDRKATEQRAAELEKEAERVRSGYKPKEHEQLNRPLAEHLKEFHTSLLLRGDSTTYADQTVRRIERMFYECNCSFWKDISASQIRHCIAGLTYRGKHISTQTTNYYVQSMKQFCKWMVQDRRANESPLEHLECETVRKVVDEEHPRRALEIDELRHLLEVTKAGPKRFGMTGYERYLLYRLAAETGLRAKELRTLKVSSFDFDNLIVCVSGANTKNKREAMQRLRLDTAQELKRFFSDKLPNAKAFGGTCRKLTKRTAEMVKADLADANISYVVDGLFFDFHALRHQTGTLLAASGVHPKVAQSIMRHGDINLTLSRYSHTLTGQEAKAVESMPDLSLPSGDKLIATGTDDFALEVSENNKPDNKPEVSGLQILDNKEVTGNVNGQISVAPLYLVFCQNMIVVAPCVREDLARLRFGQLMSLRGNRTTSTMTSYQKSPSLNQKPRFWPNYPGCRCAIR